MAGDTEAFFARLAGLGHEPMLGRTTATVRVDLANGRGTDHWVVSIKRGNLAVARSGGPADLVIVCDRTTFDELAAGRLNAMATALRGAIQFEGDPSLLVRFQRLFPAPTAPPLGASASDRAVGKRRS
ncbi:MAG TPA: SCP2 sterol-binding domain-containing protein [Candidatus Limnocylindrales bacterium]|nr:SCP2 sterol-binding domain-containing protein [Candidatus Limnocylindrales bacterium]